MSTRVEKVACRASWCDEISERFPTMSFSTATGRVTHYEPFWVTGWVAGMQEVGTWATSRLIGQMALAATGEPWGRPFTESFAFGYWAFWGSFARIWQISKFHKINKIERTGDSMIASSALRQAADRNVRYRRVWRDDALANQAQDCD
jgi:hypothetical protein